MTARTRRGFTLTEIAIVMGVIGFAIGGIWVAAAKINEAVKVNTAIKEMTTVISGYRALYSEHGFDTTGANADITCIGIRAGIFPVEMSPNTNCVPGVAFIGYPSLPWLTNIAVGGSSLSVIANAPENLFSLNFSAVPVDACIALVLAAQADPTLVFESISGTMSQYLPPIWPANRPFSNAVVAVNCAAGWFGYSFSIITLGFSLR